MGVTPHIWFKRSPIKRTVKRKEIICDTIIWIGGMLHQPLNRSARTIAEVLTTPMDLVSAALSRRVLAAASMEPKVVDGSTAGSESSSPGIAAVGNLPGDVKPAPRVVGTG